MNVLFVIPSLKGGGQEKAGMLLCNYLMQYHTVTAVCFEPQSTDEFDYKCSVIRVLIPSSANIFQKISAGYSRIKRLKKIKQQLAIDTSIAFGNTAIILNVLAGNKEKKVSSIRQSFISIKKSTALQMKLHLKLYVWALKKSDKIVSVSNAINNELKMYFNISNNTFINNGYDEKLINKLAEHDLTILNKNKIWLAHTGRFDESKGHWHLVKIFAQIKKTIPNAGLILIGNSDTSTANGSAILQYTQNYLSSQNISWSSDADSNADVLYLGYQSNPFKFLKQATLFVFPSLWEGFPNALVEAMTCGTAVVAADCNTGPKEILLDNEAEYGLLLPSFDDSFNATDTTVSALEKQWATAIISLLKDENRLSFFENQAKKRADNFTVEAMGDKWLKLLSELNNLENKVN